MTKHTILTLGSVLMELTLNTYRLPAPGETLYDDGGVGYLPSGYGTRSALALSRLGAESAILCKLGADTHGKKLYDFFKGNRIVTGAVKVDHELPSALTVKISVGGEESRRLVFNGASETLSNEQIAESFSTLRPTALSVGFDVPMSQLQAAAKLASAAQIPIFADATGLMPETELPELPVFEVLTVSERDTVALTGIRPQGTDASLRAALAIFRMIKTRFVVLKLGERGAFLYDGKHCNVIAPKKVRGAVGAADADVVYNAALILHYLNSGNLKGALEYASYAYAAALSKGGSLAAYPTAEEVYRFAEGS